MTFASVLLGSVYLERGLQFIERSKIRLFSFRPKAY